MCRMKDNKWAVKDEEGMLDHADFSGTCLGIHGAQHAAHRWDPLNMASVENTIHNGEASPRWSEH